MNFISNLKRIFRELYTELFIELISTYIDLYRFILNFVSNLYRSYIELCFSDVSLKKNPCRTMYYVNIICIFFELKNKVKQVQVEDEKQIPAENHGRTS